MEAVLLVIHVIIATALIGMVLIQRSDSDGFGLGSGGGSGFMSSRGTANLLTRTTAILATLFIISSLVLGIIASNRSSDSIVDTIVSDAIPEAESKSSNKINREPKIDAGDAVSKQGAPKEEKSTDIPQKQPKNTTLKKDVAPSVPAAQ